MGLACKWRAEAGRSDLMAIAGRLRARGVYGKACCWCDESASLGCPPFGAPLKSPDPESVRVIVPYCVCVHARLCDVSVGCGGGVVGDVGEVWAWQCQQ